MTLIKYIQSYRANTVKMIILFFLLSNAVSAQLDNLRTGLFNVEHSIVDILGEEGAKTYQEWIDIQKPIEWQLHIPDRYDANNPPGVLLYVSPTDDVYAPSNWLATTEDKNLIWISALNSGNTVPTNERITMAMLALEVIQTQYKIDPNRIYITGFSGGGRIASLAATYFPDIFKGAIYICGANFWNPENQINVDKVIQNRFVFLTGSNDFNLVDTKQVYAKYKKAGVENIKLIIVPRMGHSNPNRRKLAQALDYLDKK